MVVENSHQTVNARSLLSRSIFFICVVARACWMFGSTLCDQHACALCVVVQAAVRVQVNGGCDGLGFQVVLCVFDVMALYKTLVAYL